VVGTGIVRRCRHHPGGRNCQGPSRSGGAKAQARTAGPEGPEELMNQPQMIVSDIDGTLLNSKERVSPRLREAVRRLTASGTIFTLASGRPARWMLPVLEQLPIRPLCICANGAVNYD